LRRYLEQIGSSESDLDARQIAERAKRGDVAAVKVFEETGFFLGKAIASAVNVLNPQKVIIGGGVALSFDLFYPELKKTLDSMVFRMANQNLTVEPTALGYNATLYGAAAVGFESVNKKQTGA